jgi:hypothetical protein
MKRLTCLVARIIAFLRRCPGYVHMSLSYYCRGRGRDVDDGKDKEDSCDHLVPTHFREIA